MHFKVLSLSHYFAVGSPPPPGLVFLFLYWTSKDRRIMLINSTKTSWKTESEDTGVNKHECVFERVRGSVWIFAYTCTVKWVCICLCLLEYVSLLYVHAFVLPRDPSTSFFHTFSFKVFWFCHLTFPTAQVPVGHQSKLGRLKPGDISCKNNMPLVILLTQKVVRHLTKHNLKKASLSWSQWHFDAR